MKRIIAPVAHGELEGWLIQDMQDLTDYVEFMQPEIGNGIRRLIRSNASVDRFDHMVTPDEFGGLLAHAFQLAEMKGGNPLLKIGFLFEDKIKNFAMYLARGEKIIVNDVGGFCFVDTYTEIEAPKRELHEVINDDTLYINLENDPTLEVYTHKNLFELDPNFSYVTEMSRITYKEFVGIFTEFKNKGGIGIWQYTTGMDVDQMDTFMRAALQVGLTHFVFNFNMGINWALKEFINRWQNANGVVSFIVNDVQVKLDEDD